MPDFSVDSPTSVYVRIADWIEARIKSEELKPGARLPAERDVARDFGVAYDTVRRAAALLRERDLIITVHGRGTYVA
jgi:GntR family transcriptional regulator